jgi:hypothetical protein
MAETSNELALALHGPLAVRLVNRMMQFRTDRAKALIESKTANEMNVKADLDRYAEAKALIAIVRAHDGLSGVDAHGDAGEGERLYGLGVGHVLTDQDVKDIELLLADYNDALTHEAEKWDQARQATLREIGGEALVAAAAAHDQKLIDESVERVMAKFRQMTNSSEVAGTDS